MLWQRVVSAVVLIPAVICTIWFAPYWLFATLFGMVILLGVYEFFTIVRRIDVRPFVEIGLIITALFVSSTYFFSNNPSFNINTSILSLLGVAVALTGYVAYYLHRFIKRPSAITVMRWLWTVAGVIYVGWLGAHFIALRGVEGAAGGFSGLDTGRRWVIIALVATFAADTFAYFVGHLWGKHKMAPSISPSKTWEGAAGGFVGGLGATLLLAYVLGIARGISWNFGWKLIVLGCLIPIFALLGDLVESKFKRSTGVKDAGSIIPGHGGILDRLDSILFTVFVVYYYVIWVIM